VKKLISSLLVAACFGAVGSALSQGTAFVYQGQLVDTGSPANGVYDLTFALFNAGGQVGGALTNYATPVANGLFSVTLDYGQGVFNGSNLWLQIGVRTNGGGAFAALAPMQPILPAPGAIMANMANGLAGQLPAAQLSGAGSNMVTLDNAANSFAGSFTGDGAGLSNVNAALLNGLAGSSYATLNALADYATIDSLTNYATANLLTNYATLASLAGSQSQSASPVPNIRVFASSGTYLFTVPANVTNIAVEIWGGGGGGGGSTSFQSHGSGGGAGGYGKGVFAVTPGGNYTVVVGAGGSGGTSGAAASPGAASSFGALISAGGGSAGTNNASTSGSGGAGGASTAPINITGGAGQWTSYVGSTDGGSAGNGGSGGRGDSGAGAGAGQAPGGGGGGGDYDPGGSGGCGRVIISY
jgi:hypothetical protein